MRRERRMNKLLYTQLNSARDYITTENRMRITERRKGTHSHKNKLLYTQLNSARDYNNGAQRERGCHRDRIDLKSYRIL